MMQWRHSGLVNFINRGADGSRSASKALDRLTCD